MLPLVTRAAARLRALTPLQPALAIVLGSGFQSVLPEIEIESEIPFHQLPGFPRVRVDGHAGRLIVGHLGGVPVFVVGGRAHYYEGYEMAAVTFPIRTLAARGVRAVLLTNAAGGINRKFRPGDFMALTDHINFMGANPLRGQQGTAETCFVDLSQTYDRALVAALRGAARDTKVRLHSGVYLAVSGPCYETPAEIRAFARLGADAVGMSTVPEAIVARQCGMHVAALSCITNLAAGRQHAPLSHAEVLGVADRVQAPVRRLLPRFVQLAFRRVNGWSV